MKHVDNFNEYHKMNESDTDSNTDSVKKHNYMMLNRYQSDCEYFLNYGRGSESVLYYKSIAKHIDEMKKLWNSFSETEKPEWLTYEEIEQYEKDMLSYGK